jgi:hypothetical protein
MNWKWAWVLLLGLLSGCDADKQNEIDQDKAPPAPPKTTPKEATLQTLQQTDASKEEIETLRKEVEELRKQIANDPLAKLSAEELAALREKEQNIRRYCGLVHKILQKMTPGIPRDEVRKLAGEPDEVNGDADEYLEPGFLLKLIVNYHENKLSAVTFGYRPQIWPFTVEGRALGGTITIALVDGSASASIKTEAGETGEQVRSRIAKATDEWFPWFDRPCQCWYADSGSLGETYTAKNTPLEKSLAIKSTDPGLTFTPAVTESAAKYDATANRVELKWSKPKGVKYAVVHRDGKKILETLACTCTDELPKGAPQPRVYQIVSYSAVGDPGDMAKVAVTPAENIK